MFARGHRTTVVVVNGSVVRTSSATARIWRMRQWPNDPTVAHLIFVDHQTVPSADAIERMLAPVLSRLQTAGVI